MFFFFPRATEWPVTWSAQQAPISFTDSLCQVRQTSFGFKVLFTISCSTTTSQMPLWTDVHPTGKHLSNVTPSTSLALLFPPFQATASTGRRAGFHCTAPSPRCPALGFPSLTTSLLLLACQPSSLWNPLHHLLPISFSTYSPHRLLWFRCLPAPPGAHAEHFTTASVAPAPLPLWPSDASSKKCQALLGNCSVSTF